MITFYKKSNLIAKEDQNEIEIRGLSTDDKPTEVDGKDTPNGTIFLEIDTGKLYIYDLENELWKEV